MKQLNKRILSLLLLLALVCSVLLPTEVSAASRKIITTPTGYDSADDVDYQTTNGTIHNWGARGEDCVFLSTYAENFYTGSNTYDALSELTGSKTQADVPTSELYKALQTLMKSAHKKIQSYQDTRDYYKYTDCVLNDSSLLSSFYSGKMVNSTWDSGKTYNREHTWPNSKCINTNKTNDSADIMMLRPTVPSENGSRGNKAYGLSTGFQDPGVDVRGDCARIVLYVYVRWGNTGKMWGSSGVIENQNILFQWMAEDPVDTWEMGRNDSVQSITGTRNVFVDYPELAYTLFGREIPTDMVTPSGEAKDSGSAPVCTHSETETRDAKDATCTEDGYTGDTYCQDCGEKVSSGTKIAATGHKNENGDATCDICQADVTCAHGKTELRNAKQATCCADGYSGDTVCTICQTVTDEGETIPASGAHTFGDWVITKEATATEHGSKERTCTVGGFKETAVIPMTGSTSQPTDPTDAPTDPTEVPTDPTEAPTDPTEVPTDPTKAPTDPKETDPVVTVPAATEPVDSGADNESNSTIIIVIVAIAGAGVIATAVILILKKRKK